MDILSVAGIAITAAAIAVLLRQYKQEYAMLIGLGTGVAIFVYVILRAVPAFTEVTSLLNNSGVNQQYAVILFKALGICLVTQLASDGCRDAGETAIASKVELAGKFAILLVALPLFKQIAQLAVSLLQQ